MAAINSTSSFSTNSLLQTNAKLNASAARLASGRRITQAAEDVAGLSIGTALLSQTSALRAALGNTNQASSLLQVTGGGLSQQLEILDRQRSLALQASSGQLTDQNRSALNQESQALTAQLDQIASSTNFNGVSLLAGGSLSFNVGADAADTLSVNLPTTDTTTIFAGTAPDLSSSASAQASLATIDAAIASLSSAQAATGAAQSQFGFAGNSLSSAIQQQAAAASNILDTDFASESSNFAALKVQQQADIATRAQTNKLSRNVLQLLQ